MRPHAVRAALVGTLLLAVTAGGAAANPSLLLPAPDGEVLTLLLLGSDDGPPRTGDLRAARADGFHLLSVAGDRQHATVVSLPRDSWVPIPGRGNDRINACLNHGPELCVSTVEAAFGIEVDGYLLTSMDALKGAVTAFGGLTIDVQRPLYDGGADIRSPGEQRLTGSQALTYARDRKNRADGDIGRSQAQAELLTAAHAEVVASGDVTRALQAATILRRYTLTDLSGPRLAQLALEALHLPPAGVERVIVPSRQGRAGAAAVVFLDDAAGVIIRDAADDGRLGGG